MAARISAVFVGAFSIYTLYLFVPALLDSAEFAAFLTELSVDSKASPLDQGNWLMHWRVACVFAIVCAVLGVVAGIGIFLRRRWSWLLLTGIAICCTLVNVGINVVGYSRYAFEVLQWPQNLAFLVVAVAAVHEYRKGGLVNSRRANA